MSALLEVEGLRKRFGGLQALDGVTLQVAGGELVGLIGPNGAGKTTLFDCLLGEVSPDAGTVSFGNRRIDRLPPFARARLGIGRTFQRLELFAGLSARDHVLLALQVHNGTARLWRDLVGIGRPSPAERREAETLLELTGLTELADLPVEALSLGHGRLVELARALAGSPRLLLLDEPSSGLDDSERRGLVRVLHEVRAARGTAVVLVEHDLELVAGAVHRLVVLDAGRVLADGAPAQVLAEPEVRRAYLGTAA